MGHVYIIDAALQHEMAPHARMVEQMNGFNVTVKRFIAKNCILQGPHSHLCLFTWACIMDDMTDMHLFHLHKQYQNFALHSIVNTVQVEPS